jgi:hypothetical protein
VKVLNSKGIANRTGSESCAAHREMRDEALTGEPAGQTLSRESFKSVQGADAVSVAEGNKERCDSASACSALLGIAALEDKIVQRAVVEVLNAILFNIAQKLIIPTDIEPTY